MKCSEILVNLTHNNKTMKVIIKYRFSERWCFRVKWFSRIKWLYIRSGYAMMLIKLTHNKNSNG